MQGATLDLFVTSADNGATVNVHRITDPAVAAADDLQIRIPASFPMAWETIDVTAKSG